MKTNNSITRFAEKLTKGFTAIASLVGGLTVALIFSDNIRFVPIIVTPILASIVVVWMAYRNISERSSTVKELEEAAKRMMISMAAIKQSNEVPKEDIQALVTRLNSLLKELEANKGSIEAINKEAEGAQ